MRETNAAYRITDLESAERPRERLAKSGADALNNAELLAILLRVGLPGENAVQLGSRLLHDLGGLQGIHRASYEEVCAQHGIGIAKAAQIKAAIELGRRLAVEVPESKPVIHSPSDAANLVQYEMGALEQEELRVILLDIRNHVERIITIYKGTLNSSHVRVGELFKQAVRSNSAAIIIAHNHPSGDPTPSPDDIALTKAIVQAGKLLDVDVLDHLVIGKGQFVSLKEKGMGFG